MERRPEPRLNSAEAALVALGEWLRSQSYSFSTTTPLTHRRVNARPENAAAVDLRGVFGWSRPFAEPVLPVEARALLEQAGQLERQPDGRLKSGVRFSTLAGLLVAHSAFPTEATDSVFLGPDTHRFLSLLQNVQPTGERLVEVGSGSGVAALSLAPRFATVTLCDINEQALRCSRVNAVLAGVHSAEIFASDVLHSVEGAIDCVIANPPYLVDDSGRAYRHGGNQLGTELALRIVAEAMARLSPGGTLVLYTGAPVVDGSDVFRARALPLLEGLTSRLDYRELDPDVFGEELDKPVYRSVERLAAVALVATRSSG